MLGQVPGRGGIWYGEGTHRVWDPHIVKSAPAEDQSDGSRWGGHADSPPGLGAEVPCEPGGEGDGSKGHWGEIFHTPLHGQPYADADGTQRLYQKASGSPGCQDEADRGHGERHRGPWADGGQAETVWSHAERGHDRWGAGRISVHGQTVWTKYCISHAAAMAG